MDIIDRFSTTLASGYTAGGTSLTLNSNVGLPSGLCDFYLLILAEGSNTEEVFHVSSMSGVAATVAGAQANSTASNHASGAQVIASIWTKAAFQALDVRNTTQAAGKVFAGPGSGSPAAPVFRSLVAADLPNPGASSLGGVQSKTSASHQFLTQIGTDGVVAAAQPADTDISFTDNTTGNVSTTKHGYTPKLPNDAAKFLDGTGAYSTPAGGGTVTHSAGALTSNAPVLGNGSGDIKVGTTAQLVPTLPSDATKYLDGSGAWSVPAGGGAGPPGPDTPPGSPTVYDDEFTATSLNSQWSTVNLSPATFTYGVYGTYLLMDVPVGGGTDNWHLVVEAAPSAPYTIRAKITAQSHGTTNYSYWGIIIRDSSTGKLVVFGFASDVSLHVSYWNSATSFGSHPWTWGGTYGGDFRSLGWVYLQIEDDGANFNFSISKDGIIWLPLYSAARTAFLTTPNQIGFGAGNSTGNELVLEIDWLRKS